MCQVAAPDVPMCKPLEFGTSEEGVYSIQTWIDGVDAEEILQSFEGNVQYAYGFEAGQILKKFIKFLLLKAWRIGRAILTEKPVIKSKCMRNAQSNTKMGRRLLIILTLTDICLKAAQEHINTEITDDRGR